MSAPEHIPFTEEQQTAYDSAFNALNESSTFLAPIPKLVSVEDEIPAAEDEIVTLITPSRGHHELYRALELLEGLEKEEQTLAGKTPLTRQLTELVTGETYLDSQLAIQALEVLGKAVPRRVCQHPFKKNDIVWVCRTCQADETCVLCHACFSHSQHDGHDVAFYHAQAGGCCDCGDPDAWDPAGFCPRHGPDALRAASTGQQSALPITLENRVRGVVPACIDWMVKTVANNAEVAYARANPPRPKRGQRTVIVDGVANQAVAASPDEMEVENDDDEMLEESFPVNSVRHARAHVFSPAAASTSSSLSEDEQRASAAAEVLGADGRTGHGLYVVLHADDIHSSQQLLDALRDFLGTSNYYTDTLLGKLVRALRQYGQLVVWGTMELVQECGATQVHLWMDGDKVASSRIGAVILERASRLTNHGIFCSILTRDELILEQRAVAVLQWVSAVAKSCDPLCLTVAECIVPNRHLVPLLRADFKMSARVTKSWYSLLLTLLAVPTFKSHLAAAYCDTYRVVTSKYARGMGVLERSGYTLSVQFLNRVTYVIDLVQGRDLLGKLGKSLLETLLVATQAEDRRLDPNHFVLTHRRYSPCVSDLKCVLNVSGMPRVIAANGGTFLKDWVSSLSLAQFMDTQIWRYWAQGHVEDESRGWVGAFNASISLGSLFERLLGWCDEETSPIQVGPLSHDLRSCVELTFHILTTGIDPWQRSESRFYEATAFTTALEPFARSPASLPFSTIAARQGTALAMSQLSVSQISPFSFHLPLHRFVAGCLRELCLRKNSDNGGISDLLLRLRTQLSENQYSTLFQGLMEFPALVLSRAAQVRAGLWRRNGAGLNDQVLNYAEPPFCRNMRDADLLLTQFATIGRNHRSPGSRPSSDLGISVMVNLMLHRFGLFEFAGLAKAPTWYTAQYSEEVSNGLYPAEKKAQENDEELRLPWAYSPARDSASSMLLLEEFLHFIIVFIVELPPVVPQHKEEQTRQAKFRLFREVVHRLASGPKTHSELSEVHHVLSHWDNLLLSEEGKLVNPDDATGAALGTVLDDIAERKVSRMKMEPDKWELVVSSWDSYDPAFFHTSLRSHQTAAEGRPKPSQDSAASFGWQAKPYAPVPIAAHPFFGRLRRDTTADVTVLAVAYRVLHVHCRGNIEKSLVGLRGNLPYEKDDRSETALARTIHLLTLGAYAWKDSLPSDMNWRDRGGGSVGSIFADRGDTGTTPTAGCWVKSFLLAEPNTFLDCEWYEGEEKALVLLQRLAVSGGTSKGFIAQDSAVRSGAAWLCEFALSCCSEASTVISPVKKATPETVSVAKSESDVEKRKKMAKEKAMARMKAQAEKFKEMMDLGSEEDSVQNQSQDISVPGTPTNGPTRGTSFGSNLSAASSKSVYDSESGVLPSFVAVGDAALEESAIPPRLLQSRPRCIICNDEDSLESSRPSDDDGEVQRKKSRRRTENALGFVGYAQASTVMKGGGGPPPHLDSSLSPTREFVGTHVALCGHAVHSECCESYLATVSHREDRQIGKRDEFRCPLCQRLSNCLVPFIDVSVDWIDCPSCPPVDDSPTKTKICDDMQLEDAKQTGKRNELQHFLESTPWWVTRRSTNVSWDGQSAFVERTLSSGSVEGEKARKPPRIRSLKKKDLYAAWNAMMRTPRFVRRRLRRPSSRSPAVENEATPPTPVTTGEDSIGETVVWRRLIDQISDISYRADSKRLGDDHLHDLFGEFRHYIVEKYGYNIANRFTGNEPTDWPSCMFSETLGENRRQEMSREKLLSKLLLSVQAFTYSCSSEAFEARRAYRKCMSSSSEVAQKAQDSSFESVFSRFGISGVVCGGRMVVMPSPSAQEDGDGWPFDGRLGKLRYFGLAVMAASGAVAADLVQLVLPFPLHGRNVDPLGMEVDAPDRAPIAYPILFGNVLTHVVAAMCAACGRARARSDSLDVMWPIPFSPHGSFAFADFTGNEKSVDCVVEDCEGFLKMGMLARMLQVLLGSLGVAPSNFENPRAWIAAVKQVIGAADDISSTSPGWVNSCTKLMEIAFSSQPADLATMPIDTITLDRVEEACTLAAASAGSFLTDAGTILQILLPGVMSRYAGSAGDSMTEPGSLSSFDVYEKSMDYFKLESVDNMLQSPLVQEMVSNWFDEARRNAKAAVGLDEASTALRSRLYRTQGFRVHDWPSAGTLDNCSTNCEIGDKKDSSKIRTAEQQPQDDVSTPSGQLESIQTPSRQASTADVLRSEASPTLLTFNTKKSVSLLGGYSPSSLHAKSNNRPRVVVIPTSYTDLYAELGSLMPECEQTAVCLICGEVLNAGGKGECTRHSYKCGAGAGMFFLLQECSGLIMHKSKASYIHSPYVDSHGETPQYRGRPLNLDVDRYEHLREVWFSHGVRQKVVQERGSSRQIIVPDFY